MNEIISKVFSMQPSIVNQNATFDRPIFNFILLSIIKLLVLRIYFYNIKISRLTVNL